MQGARRISLWRVFGATALAVAAVAAGLLLIREVPTASAGPAAVYNLVSVDSFAAPTYADNAPGEPTLLFVAEREGVIRIVENGATRDHPFLDIQGRVGTTGEGGLLSLAFHPDYRQNRRFYVYYTNNDGNLEIDEYKRAKAERFRAKESSRRRVIVIPHPNASNHNGGTIAFGAHGRLYLATGDGAVEDNARDLQSLLGKVIRMRPIPGDDPNEPGYEVPGANPLVGEPGKDLIWAWGLRNPFRFSFDYPTLRIAIADVGQSAQEEINLKRIREAAGGNFGWPRFEGDLEDTNEPAGRGPYLPPMHTYANDLSNNNVTGGVVIRDPELPQLEGRYVFADFAAGDLITFQPDVANNEADDVSPLGLEVAAPVAFVHGARNQLYVVSLAGTVFRLEET